MASPQQPLWKLAGERFVTVQFILQPVWCSHISTCTQHATHALHATEFCACCPLGTPADGSHLCCWRRQRPAQPYALLWLPYRRQHPARPVGCQPAPASCAGPSHRWLVPCLAPPVSPGGAAKQQLRQRQRQCWGAC